MTEGRLEGRVAIVTGGTEGIGLAVARRFAAEGARLVVVARREGPGRDLVDELGPERVRFVAGDVAEEATAKLAVATALKDFERLDVLVNNAALDFTADLLETSLDEFRQVLAVDLLGAFLMLREAGRVMCEKGGGAIVNLTSRTAAVGVATMGAYSAAKAGLTSLTRVAAIEWAARGVRVNAVAPGPTETPLMRAWIEQQPDPSRFRWEVASSSPLGRLALPEEVAGAVLYLASPEARHITGAVLPIDGGYTAQ